MRCIVTVSSTAIIVLDGLPYCLCYCSEFVHSSSRTRIYVQYCETPKGAAIHKVRSKKSFRVQSSCSIVTKRATQISKRDIFLFNLLGSSFQSRNSSTTLFFFSSFSPKLFFWSKIDSRSMKNTLYLAIFAMATHVALHYSFISSRECRAQLDGTISEIE